MCFVKGDNQVSSSNSKGAFSKIENAPASQIEHNPDFQNKNMRIVEEQLPFRSEALQTFWHPYQPQVNLIPCAQLSTLMNLIKINDSIIFNLIKRNEQMERSTRILSGELADLKKLIVPTNSKKLLTSIPLHENDLDDQMISRLFGHKDYKYAMVLAEPMSKQLYKQRNFNIKINLVDSENNVILNSNPIPISLNVYTSEQVPTVIMTNKSGQPILKGSGQSELFHGLGEFCKIHLREVSSYYMNGQVYLVIFPKMPSFGYNAKESSLEQSIDYELIKPLIISEVVISAKKK